MWHLSFTETVFVSILVQKTQKIVEEIEEVTEYVRWPSQTIPFSASGLPSLFFSHNSARKIVSAAAGESALSRPCNRITRTIRAP